MDRMEFVLELFEYLNEIPDIAVANISSVDGFYFVNIKAKDGTFTKESLGDLSFYGQKIDEGMLDQLQSYYENALYLSKHPKHRIDLLGVAHVAWHFATLLALATATSWILWLMYTYRSFIWGN